ncbi:MAG: DNA polymerase III subunit gamma/tau [Anaerolineales bacterium]|jgi:DNA polymerase-3 subunit gamma/tau
MSQALYRKWRPQKWDEVIGQAHVVQTLRNAVAGGHVAHAYLFSGPRGTGKTTVARLLAKAVNCLAEDPALRPCNQCAHCTAVNEGRFLDLIEIDAASNTSVEDVRDLRDKINFSPNQGKFKVYIIDEVHMLSTAAFNALLKTLEEPPPHAIFILATTEIHKIPATVLSRCQRYEFRRLPVDELVGQLKHIVASEQLVAEPEALTLIARQATGSSRDAISLLDQLASAGRPISLALTQNILGSAANQTVLDVLAALLAGTPGTGLEAIHAALDSGTDPRLLARQVVEYLRALLLVQMGNESQVELPAETLELARRHAKAFTSAEVLRLIRLFNAAASDVRGGWQPALPLELALVEALATPATPPSAPAAPARTGGRTPAPGTPPQARPERAASKAEPRKGTDKAPSQAAMRKDAGTAPTGAVSLDPIVKAWKQICAFIKPQNPSLNGLLNSCKLLEIKDGVLVLGFASELVRSKADTPEQLDIARRAIVEITGMDLPLRCVLSRSNQSAPADVKQDGMVAAALKAGGEIVDIQE